MLKEIMKNTIEYVNSFPKKERKSYGQFLLRYRRQSIWHRL